MPPTLQVFPVSPVIHNAVTSVRIPWENRWLPQSKENPGRLFTKEGVLLTEGERGLREPERESKPPGPARGGGTVTTPRAGGKQEGRSPANNKRVTEGMTDLESNDIPSSDTACPRSPPEERAGFPDLPLGHFTGPTHWVRWVRNLPLLSTFKTSTGLGLRVCVLLLPSWTCRQPLRGVESWSAPTPGRPSSPAPSSFSVLLPWNSEF